MEDIIKLAARTAYPHSWYDIVVSAIILVVLLWKPAFWIRDQIRFKKVVVGTWMLSPLIFMVTVGLIVPLLQRFDDDKMGILITRMHGASLEDHLGESGIHELIAADLTAFMQVEGFGDVVKIRPVSWTAKDEASANSLRDKFGADAVLWGSVTKIESGAQLNLTFDPGAFGFAIWYPGSDTIRVSFKAISHGKYTVGFGASGPKLEGLRKLIATDLMPTISAEIGERFPERACTLFKLYTRFEERLGEFPFGPFIIHTAGGCYESAGELEKALDAYSKASLLYEKLRAHETTVALAEFPPDSDIVAFAAACKLQEGVVAFKLGDSATANVRILEALFIDKRQSQQLYNKAKGLTGWPWLR